MPRLKLALFALAALITGGFALLLWFRLGTAAAPLALLSALVSLTCILRIITLIR